jgi:hypothetical protein
MLRIDKNLVEPFSCLQTSMSLLAEHHCEIDEECDVFIRDALNL